MPTRQRPAACLAAGLLAALALWIPAAAGAQISVTPAPAPTPVPAPICVATIDPAPTGVLGRPTALFPPPASTPDHNYLHSSTHLQGNRAYEKWTGGLLYRPPVASGFDSFTSAIVVDNPDPTQQTLVEIDYFDHAGTLVTTTGPHTILPEGFHVEAATPLDSAAGFSGVGAARVRVIEGPGIVGATLLQTPCMTNFTGTICGTGPPFPILGAASMEQLQVVQPEAKELWWGPLPLTLISSIDFFNAHAPFFWVVNPNNAMNNIRVDLVAFDHVSGTAVPFTWRNISLPPFGTLLEKSGPHLTTPPLNGLWDQFFNWYATVPQPYDYDIMVHVVSESSLPILGDGVMTDIYGDQADHPRFRMASHMLATSPTWRLIEPDFSSQPGGIIRTLIGLFNAGTADAGPVRIEYRDRNGAVVGTGTIPSLPPNRSVRIEPGTFGYPAGTVGFGWVRISACTTAGRLVGWTVHEILETPPTEPHYHEAYGDILDGNGGAEPAGGFQVTNASGTWIRKVSPLVRTWPSWFWPGYTTFANTTVGNVGQYWFRFFDMFGIFGAACTNTALQPFAGVPWARTSTTYEDPESLCGPTNLSGRVDVTTGRIKGISVLGDPFIEYGIPGFGNGPIEN